MTPPGADTVLLRYGELGTKSSRVRGRMVTTLCENVDALLADRELPSETEYRMARPVVHVDGTSDDADAGDVDDDDTAVVEAVARAAADSMGIVSTSPALLVAPEREAILDALAETARKIYDAGTFAVRVQRADETLPFTSPEIEREGGTAVWGAVADRLDPEVDLDDPDHVFEVEVRSDVAYVFTDRVAGPGGLPLGTQHRLVALISGGLDSPVAAYEAMRRGSRVVPVYLDLGDYGGVDHRARAVQSVRMLSRYDPDLDGLFTIPAGETVAHLAEEMESGRMLAFRRYMFGAAEALAHRNGAVGIVTGEAIGQKSSQTTANLAVTSRATDLPVHRPLLTVDKTEIVDRARGIGTFEDATISAGCNRLAPAHPETNASLDRLREREPDDLFERAERDAAAAEWVEW